ncbi:MAG: DUF899 domain-containing protein [Gammaproteobacteria bacterium]|nr:MAG: DUF899 domain-containing protein [Gammaproteobacteria bacterium]
MTTEIVQLEQQIFELTTKLNELRKSNSGEVVTNYVFDTQAGETNLLELFGDHDRLLAIHNMGQACRYCTLWADGLNGFLPHLESTMAVVLVSKDSPETQRTFANSRGWRFRLASHGGGDYAREQTVARSVAEGSTNMPGAVVYERKGDDIVRKNAVVFGPGDLYCSMWSLLALAGLSEETWTPQFNYWRRPEVLEDGGENLLD